MKILALLLLVAAFVAPNIQGTIRKTLEARLRDDLFTMCAMIDRITADNKRPPTSLDEMVATGYLGDVPTDPITQSNETWVLVTENYSVTNSETVEGIVDVQSDSDEISLQGTPYSSL
jgi:general secretion pathway protein G